MAAAVNSSLAATFRALGDETRLGLLASLREQGEQRAGDLAARYPRLSRPAISQHLAVLRQAGLVRAERRGTERWYRLEAAPLRALDQGWMAAYRAFWDQRVQRLRALVEPGQEAGGDAEDGRAQDPV